MRDNAMLERQYWRATYDEKRQSFDVANAGWANGEPVIEYGFNFFHNDNASCGDFSSFSSSKTEQFHRVAS